jgi:hypothetical protein
MRVSLLPLLLVSAVATGQAPFPTGDEIRQFAGSKTCVVLEDNPFSSYNEYIKKTVDESWKITPYEFITVKEFNVKRYDPRYSFLVITQTHFEKDRSNGLYNFLNLVQGKDVNTLSEMPEICAVPLSFAGVNDFAYSYKLGPILNFMQNHAQEILKDPGLTLRKYLKYYNKNIPDVKKKTILVTQDDLTPAVKTIQKIRAIYSGDIKIVSDDELMDAIDRKLPNTVIVHKVGPMGNRNSGYCFVMLLGIADSELYYFNLHLIDKSKPDGLLSDDLRRLERNNAASDE